MSGHSRLVVIDFIILSSLLFLIFSFFFLLFCSANHILFDLILNVLCALWLVMCGVCRFSFRRFLYLGFTLNFIFWDCLEFHLFSYLLPKSSNISNRFVFRCWKMDYYYYYFSSSWPSCHCFNFKKLFVYAKYYLKLNILKYSTITWIWMFTV